MFRFIRDLFRVGPPVRWGSGRTLRNSATASALFPPGRPPGDGWRVADGLNDFGQYVVWYGNTPMAAFNTREAAQAWVDENVQRAAQDRRFSALTAPMSDEERATFVVDAKRTIANPKVDIKPKGAKQGRMVGPPLAPGESHGGMQMAKRYTVGRGSFTRNWYVLDNGQPQGNEYSTKSNATRAARRLNATPPEA